MKKKIAILGSTGSIGKSTIEIIRKDKKNFDVILLTTNNNYKEILKQALENLDNWHMLVFPIIAMTITLFMITFIGEAIREAFDPKVYSRLR